jgi:hypothetical protein
MNANRVPMLTSSIGISPASKANRRCRQVSGAQQMNRRFSYDLQQCSIAMPI